MVLVTQSFGKESEYRRVVLAILSYYAQSGNTQVTTLLFTDNTAWFEPYFVGLPISYSLLSKEKVTIMRGKIDFLHRMKIALIEEAFETFGTDILYFDSDTFFIADPQKYMAQLSTQKSFMHLWEYQFESLRNMPLPAGKTFQALVSLIEKDPIYIFGTELPITADMSSWNAGVMLLHRSHASFIPEVYRLTDVIFPVTQNHASEQYAFSVLLQTQTSLSACDDVVYHYWYGVKKKIMDEYLAEGLGPILKLEGLQQRLSFIAKMTQQLPDLFENHLLTLKDNAIQTLNCNEYKKGYNWAMKAIFAGAIKDTTFIKDILYHIKRQLTKS